MKMKKILCLLLLCALSVCLFAQFEKIDVKIGEEYSYDLKEYSTRVGELNANPLQEIFISYWMSYSTHYRVAFDSKSLKATQLIKDEKEIFGLNLPMLTYKMIGGKLYCFIQGKDHKTTKLIVCEVDMKTGDWKGAPKTIVSTEDDIYSLYADGSSNWTLTPFNFEYSMDKKRIVVHYRARNYTKVDGEKYAQIDYFILDVNLQKLAEGKILG